MKSGSDYFLDALNEVEKLKIKKPYKELQG